VFVVTSGSDRSPQRRAANPRYRHHEGLDVRDRCGTAHLTHRGATSQAAHHVRDDGTVCEVTSSRSPLAMI
jgi:hypothetical protein